MNNFEKMIEARKHMHLAMAHLDCIVELMNEKDFEIMEDKVEEFKAWLNHESPIA